MSQTYLYKARNANGQIITGQMEAEDAKVVVLRLREQGCLIINIAEQKVKQALTIELPWGKKVTLKDLAVFCRQFATMLAAGLPIINCLSVLLEQTEKRKLKNILAEITSDIESGNTLSQAFGKHPKNFPQLFISLLQVGETTGTLDNIFDRLAVYYEKEYELKEKIKSAMTYPTVVMFMACFVVIALVAFILPIFEGVFADMDIQLPFLTKILLLVSHFLTQYWYLVLLVLGIFIYSLKTYLYTEKGKTLLDIVKIKLPVFGMLNMKVSISRFSMSLSIMTGSGVPVLQALEIARDSLNNRILAKNMDALQEFVRGGGSIAEFLEKNKVFPSMMRKMIAVGETTGSLDTMLSKLAEFYEKEVQFTVDRLTSLLEPFLIIFLGLVVGTIVLSIMLPMVDLIGGLNGG